FREGGGTRERNVMPVRSFDPQRYLDRKQARRMDRCSQFAVVAAQQAVRQAGLDPAREDPFRVAVVVGSAFAGIGTSEQEYSAFEDRGRVSPFAVPMYIPNMPAANVIRLGRVDVALAGGAEAAITPFVLAGFESTGALSRRDCPAEQASRPFDRERDGFVMGE